MAVIVYRVGARGNAKIGSASGAGLAAANGHLGPRTALAHRASPAGADQGRGGARVGAGRGGSTGQGVQALAHLPDEEPAGQPGSLVPGVKLQRGLIALNSPRPRS